MSRISIKIELQKLHCWLIYFTIMIMGASKYFSNFHKCTRNYATPLVSLKQELIFTTISLITNKKPEF